MKKINENTKNNYSFYTFHKNEIFGDMIEYDDNTPDDDEHYNENECVFSHSNDSIIQLYDFTNGNTELYRDLGNNELALLYTSEAISKDDVSITIFNSDKFYTALSTENRIKNVYSMDKQEFLFINNLPLLLFKIPGLKYINNYLAGLHSNKNMDVLMYEGKITASQNKRIFLNEFKQLYMRYKMASILIPAQSIIKQILKDINQYIASGKLNQKDLLTNYIQLLNFQEYCPGCIQTISPIINDLNSADLRNICDYLTTKIGNMENLINMYLSDELEK